MVARGIKQRFQRRAALYGLSKTGDPPSIITSKLFWTFGNFSKFIRPGMRRVELEGDGHDMNGLLGSAWFDEDRSRAVLVYLNEGSTAEDVEVRISKKHGALPAGEAVPFITSGRDGDDLKQYPAVPARPDGKLIYTVPARSAVTILIPVMPQE